MSDGDIPIDPRRKAEDDIASEIGGWTDFKRKFVYRLLNSLGERMGSIDYEIDKAWRKEQGK